MHQGKKLKQYIKKQDFSFSQVSRKLNQRSKNTIHNWFDREELSANMFSQLVTLFPNIMDEFPDVEWKPKKVAVVAIDESGAHWREKYFQLTEDFTALSKKYTDLLEDKIKTNSHN